MLVLVGPNNNSSRRRWGLLKMFPFFLCVGGGSDLHGALEWEGSDLQKRSCSLGIWGGGSDLHGASNALDLGPKTLSSVSFSLAPSSRAKEKRSCGPSGTSKEDFILNGFHWVGGETWYVERRVGLPGPRIMNSGSGETWCESADLGRRPRGLL